MDRLHLIAEILQRPALWDLQSEEYKSRISVPVMWKEVAASMGPDVTVNECKRKWKNLRDAYRAEIKRIEVRIERDLLKGVYDSKTDYGSKWAYFEHLKFLKDIKRPRRSKMNDANHLLNEKSDDDNEDIDQFSDLHDIDNIKLEPDDGTVTPPLSPDKEADENNDVQICNELPSTKAEQPQQTRTEDSSKAITATELDPQKTQIGRDDKSASTDCKCPKRTQDQMDFLEDLEKEEQILMKSTRLDITRSNDFAHVGDPDYNFLISFLPQIKKMNDIQNLKFRAKMSDFMFNIMSQPTANNVRPA